MPWVKQKSYSQFLFVQVEWGTVVKISAQGSSYIKFQKMKISHTPHFLFSPALQAFINTHKAHLNCVYIIKMGMFMFLSNVQIYLYLSY